MTSEIDKVEEPDDDPGDDDFVVDEDEFDYEKHGEAHDMLAEIKIDEVDEPDDEELDDEDELDDWNEDEYDDLVDWEDGESNDCWCPCPCDPCDYEGDCCNCHAPLDR